MHDRKLHHSYGLLRNVFSITETTPAGVDAVCGMISMLYPTL